MCQALGLDTWPPAPVYRPIWVKHSFLIFWHLPFVTTGAIRAAYDPKQRDGRQNYSAACRRVGGAAGRWRRPLQVGRCGLTSGSGGGRPLRSRPGPTTQHARSVGLRGVAAAAQHHRSAAEHGPDPERGPSPSQPASGGSSSPPAPSPGIDGTHAAAAAAGCSHGAESAISPRSAAGRVTAGSATPARQPASQRGRRPAGQTQTDDRHTDRQTDRQTDRHLRTVPSADRYQHK